MSDTDIHIHTFTHPSTIFAYMPMRLHIVKKTTGQKCWTRSLSGCADACWDASPLSYNLTWLWKVWREWPYVKSITKERFKTEIY